MMILSSTTKMKVKTIPTPKIKLHQSIGNNDENLPVAAILEQLKNDYAIVDNPTCVILGEENSQNCEVTTIVNNITIQNDNIRDPTLPNLLQTYDKALEEAADLSLHPIITENETIEHEKSKKIRKCKCGSLTHSRRTHRDCILNPLNSKHKAFKGIANKIVGSKGLRSMLESSNDPKPKYKNRSEPELCIDDDDETSKSVPVQTQNENETNDSVPVPVPIPVNQNVSTGKEKKQNEKQADYYKPLFTNIEENNIQKKYSPVIDVHAKGFKAVETSFKMYSNNQKEELPPTPSALSNHYFSKEMIENIVNSSNAYAFERKRREPNMKSWKNKTATKIITPSDIYQFFAILYYFGIVKLPSKRDYWAKGYHWMPSHPICTANNMNRERFEFLWRNFHCNHATSDDFLETENGVDDDLDDEDQLIELQLERVQRDQDHNIQEDDDDDLVEEEQDSTAEDNQKLIWYQKVKPVVDHIRAKSCGLIFILGTFHALDEMMIRFSGRSVETHRIKNKPIKEGFKFFVLATKNGFVINFSPDGRTAAKKAADGKMDYEINVEHGKIGSMIMYLVESIVKLKEKQNKRITRITSLRTTRTNDIVEKRKILNEKMGANSFIIAMDNYFTLPKVIYALRKLGVGIVGTAKYQKSWPPLCLKKIDDKKSNFNDFFWTVDPYGTLVARWMDNGMVFCVSTVHKAGQIIERCRRRPRKTLKNKAHVDRIWGQQGKVDIWIPKLIDDYNHWMGGVDLCDQHISYYHPNIRCRRNWVPMFIQMLSIIRSNSYIVHKSFFKKNLCHIKILHSR